MADGTDSERKSRKSKSDDGPIAALGDRVDALSDLARAYATGAVVMRP